MKFFREPQIIQLPDGRLMCLTEPKQGGRIYRQDIPAQETHLDYVAKVAWAWRDIAGEMAKDVWLAEQEANTP